MASFDSALHDLLEHAETLGLNEGEYLQVCNAMKAAFQNKPEEKKIMTEEINRTIRIIKMKGYTFKCLESTFIQYYGPHNSVRTFKVEMTNPKGVVTESNIKGSWSEYIQKMIRFLRPVHIEQIYDSAVLHTSLKEFMEEQKQHDIIELEMETAFKATPGYEIPDYDPEPNNIWRGDYTYGRFVDAYRIMD